TQKGIDGIGWRTPDALAEAMRPVALDEFVKHVKIGGASRSFITQKRSQAVHPVICFWWVSLRVLWPSIDFVIFDCAMDIVPLCLFGGLNAAPDAFGLLVHLWVWILPGIAH